MENPTRLSDEELLKALHALALKSNETEAELLLHLAEVDARKLYLDRAHSSLFTFCVAELNFSESATYNRILVARLARDLPQIISVVRSGKVHLSGLRILAPHLTAENIDELLTESIGKSKRQIEEIVACHVPRPAVPEVIRKLPDRALTESELAPGLTNPHKCSRGHERGMRCDFRVNVS
jgi:hypothetical protein